MQHNIMLDIMLNCSYNLCYQKAPSSTVLSHFSWHLTNVQMPIHEEIYRNFSTKKNFLLLTKRNNYIIIFPMPMNLFRRFKTINRNLKSNCNLKCVK